MKRNTEAPKANEDLRAHPHFNPWMGSQSDSKDFQRMTRLPEDLERALLDVPMGALLVRCGILGASSKYSCVQRLAETLSEAEVRKFLAQKHPADPERPVREERAYRAIPAADTKDSAPRKIRVRAASGLMADETLVRRAKGETKITPGSYRAIILEALEGPQEGLTIKALQEAVEAEGHHFEVRPVLGKLREAGWVTLNQKGE